jgi:hypothetical protein
MGKQRNLLLNLKIIIQNVYSVLMVEIIFAGCLYKLSNETKNSPRLEILTEVLLEVQVFGACAL